MSVAPAESREMSNGESSDRLPGNNFGSCTDGKCMKRTTQEITSGMWFGPRLGRRRRSGERPELGSEIEASAQDGAHWTLVKIPGETLEILSSSGDCLFRRCSHREPARKSHLLRTRHVHASEFQLTTRGNRLNLHRVWDAAPARISSPTGTRWTEARRTTIRYRRFSRRV